jgi:hypothetical protein
LGRAGFIEGDALPAAMAFIRRRRINMIERIRVRLQSGSNRAKVIRACAVLLAMSIATACTWVPVTPEGEQVRVASLERAVEGCKHLGQISARTASRVGIIPRGEEKVREELISLAKNDAVAMGANVILPAGAPSESGEQKFGAYRCPLK